MLICIHFFLFNFFSFFYDLILAPICILWYIIDKEKEINIKSAGGDKKNKKFSFFYDLTLAFICILCYIIDKEEEIKF